MMNDDDDECNLVCTTVPSRVLYSTKAVVSEDIREIIKREVRAEVYEKIAEQNKAAQGSKVSS